MGIAAITLLFINLILLILILFRSGRTNPGLTELKLLVDNLEKNLSRMETAIREELHLARAEAQKTAALGRKELQHTVTVLTDSLLSRLAEIATLQKNQLDTFANQLTALTRSNEERLETMRQTIENRLLAVQQDNQAQLERMRATVDEKLQSTLEKRLGESFKQVSERLEQVHQGLGEMQTLATGVGDLKKVLSNVKTRGILGEIQLGNILEQILNPQQYDTNVATKRDSRDNVEFAVRLPGRDDSGQVVYLPIDSKFPLENYYSLLEAYDQGDVSRIDEVIKLLENNIKKFARDIRDKYLDPPFTTDFGIMFLPVEGLYAEVLRRTDLVETLRREYKITITGPTTLAAILSSLQMGFRTLAIEKRTSEVWNVLGAVKTEFATFGDVLKSARKKLDQAGSEIDTLVGTRTRQIQRQLQNVQELPIADAKILLAAGSDQPEKTV